MDNEWLLPFVAACLFRHRTGDWGDVDGDGKRANDLAARRGRRVVSCYPVPDLTGDGPGIESRLWVITENDHSMTVVLWPSEY